MKLKSILPILSVALTVGILCSCNKSGGSDEVTYIPVQLTENGAWVFVDEAGQRIGTQEWEFQPTVTYSNIFTARTDSGLTVYRWDGDVATPIDSLRNLASVGVLNEGLMPVAPKMQRIRVVDANGDTKFILNPIDGLEIGSCSDQFHEGMLVVHATNGKTGVVNTKGDVIVAPTFDDISDFSEGYALAEKSDFNDLDSGPQYFVIDKEGKVTPVEGKFGYYGEGDCEIISQFDHGVAVEFGPADTTDYTYPQILISTDGKTKTLKDNTYVIYLDNDSKIVYKTVGDKTTAVWTSPDQKPIMKCGGDSYFQTAGKYVGISTTDSLLVYDDAGKKLFGIGGNHTIEWPGGKFGPLISTFDVNTSNSTTALYTPAGDKVIHSYFGVGTSRMIENLDDEVVCRSVVTSAYVDITAAASRICQMTAGGRVHGKKDYYIGQPIKDVLEGENVNFYAHSDRNIAIPTDSTYMLASGAGFWINGSARSSQKIAAATIQHYFEFDHFDYWGRAWGYNRTRQTGYHFNPSAKVESFDVQLRTNYPSGAPLRQAINRRLRNEGYTEVASEPNYDEYSNGASTIIIYGNADTRGIGAFICNGNSSMKDSQKAALAANL